MSELSKKWLFSNTIFTEDNLCSDYKVKQGDNFTSIGNKYKVPYEILMQINNIKNPMDLRADDTIKVIKGPFHCKVYRSTFTMDIYLQDTYVQSFPVGIGKTGTETPTGRWKVKSGGKLISPDWTDPDTGKTYDSRNPNYPLGARWIALDGIDGDTKGRTGFAIHGTKTSDQIGMAGSRGCIRLNNENVKLVYDLLIQDESQVAVFD
jgi:LysM repeat protein